MTYIFDIKDPTPIYQRCRVDPSQAMPGYVIVYRHVLPGQTPVAMVVEPSGLVRDLRPGENPDSPWCWAAHYGDLLVYDDAAVGAADNTAAVVMFRFVG
jgi:hypothetical protein